jgi:hypothetical protein
MMAAQAVDPKSAARLLDLAEDLDRLAVRIAANLRDKPAWPSKPLRS